jgi:hypothetical protein
MKIPPRLLTVAALAMGLLVVSATPAGAGRPAGTGSRPHVAQAGGSSDTTSVTLTCGQTLTVAGLAIACKGPSVKGLTLAVDPPACDGGQCEVEITATGSGTGAVEGLALRKQGSAAAIATLELGGSGTAGGLTVTASAQAAGVQVDGLMGDAIAPGTAVIVVTFTPAGQPTSLPCTGSVVTAGPLSLGCSGSGAGAVLASVGQPVCTAQGVCTTAVGVSLSPQALTEAMPDSGISFHVDIHVDENGNWIISVHFSFGAAAFQEADVMVAGVKGVTVRSITNTAVSGTAAVAEVTTAPAASAAG